MAAIVIRRLRPGPLLAYRTAAAVARTWPRPLRRVRIHRLTERRQRRC